MSATRVASRKRRARVLKIHPVPSSRLITVVMHGLWNGLTFFNLVLLGS